MDVLFILFDEALSRPWRSMLRGCAWVSLSSSWTGLGAVSLFGICFPSRSGLSASFNISRYCLFEPY